MNNPEVKNHKVLLPPQSRKADKERERETRIRVVKSTKKQPKWIRRQEED